MDTFKARVEIRDADDGSPGRLVGVLMRYGSPGQHGGERFAPGALSWADNGIRIDLDHASSSVKGNVQPPIMRAVPILSDDGTEVRIDAALPDTTAARDLATLMRADPPLYSGLSVEFNGSRSRWAGGVRTIVAAKLVGAALTDNPSYKDTGVSLRSGKASRRRIWH